MPCRFIVGISLMELPAARHTLTFFCTRPHLVQFPRAPPLSTNGEHDDVLACPEEAVGRTARAMGDGELLREELCTQWRAPLPSRGLPELELRLVARLRPHNLGASWRVVAAWRRARLMLMPAGPLSRTPGRDRGPWMLWGGRCSREGRAQPTSQAVSWLVHWSVCVPEIHLLFPPAGRRPQPQERRECAGARRRQELDQDAGALALAGARAGQGQLAEHSRQGGAAPAALPGARLTLPPRPPLHSGTTSSTCARRSLAPTCRRWRSWACCPSWRRPASRCRPLRRRACSLSPRRAASSASSPTRACRPSPSASEELLKRTDGWEGTTLRLRKPRRGDGAHHAPPVAVSQSSCAASRRAHPARRRPHVRRTDTTHAVMRPLFPCAAQQHAGPAQHDGPGAARRHGGAGVLCG